MGHNLNPKLGQLSVACVETLPFDPSRSSTRLVASKTGDTINNIIEGQDIAVLCATHASITPSASNYYWVRMQMSHTCAHIVSLDCNTALRKAQCNQDHAGYAALPEALNSLADINSIVKQPVYDWWRVLRLQQQAVPTAFKMHLLVLVTYSQQAPNATLPS